MKTVVGLFDTFEHAEQVVRDLEASGFKESDISLMAPQNSVRHDPSEATEMGAIIGAGVGILTGLATITIPGVGAVLAIGPIVAGGILGAVAGGLVGSLVEAGVPAEEAETYVEGVRRGGTLVAVAASEADVLRAVEIMSRHNPVDLKERAASWRQSGWKQEADIDTPDATGQTTMGDAVAARPAPTTAIPVPGAQPTHIEEADTSVDYRQFEPDFQRDFDRSFPGAGYTYDQCKPAYEFGCQLACESKQANWEAVEPRARGQWERTHPGTWDKMKNATKYAYERAKVTI